jgi:HORMA domain-containing protein
MSYSYTATESFTLTDARKLAAKVIADMHQCRRLYGSPPESSIEAYQTELVVLLAGRYVSEYEFGFKTSADKRIVSWQYTVTAAGDLEGGRSGGLYATADVGSAPFFNYLWRSATWRTLTGGEQAKVDAQHSVERRVGDPPADGSGRWVRDRQYVSGGVAIERKEFRPW